MSSVGVVRALSNDFDIWVDEQFPDPQDGLERSIQFVLSSGELLETMDWDWNLDIERTEGMTSKLAPFAKNGIGDCLGFVHSDLQPTTRVEAPVYFWDIHVLGIYQVANCFNDFLGDYLLKGE